jgi:hypothetical protein
LFSSFSFSALTQKKKKKKKKNPQKKKKKKKKTTYNLQPIMSALKIELKGVCEDNSVFRRLVNAHETNLNLGWQKLKSLDGATLSQLSHLKTLLLQFNSLSSIPSDIGKLTDLLELALYRNELEALPAEIGQLVSLEKLWLNDNKLAALPPTIAGLTGLVSLGLFDNYLVQLPAEIGLLTALETLDLSNNQLTSLPAEIGLLTNLKSLRLDANQLTSIAELETLTNLSVLCLKNDSFDAEDDNDLPDLGDLVDYYDSISCATHLHEIVRACKEREPRTAANAGKITVPKTSVAFAQMLAALQRVRVARSEKPTRVVDESAAMAVLRQCVARSKAPFDFPAHFEALMSAYDAFDNGEDVFTDATTLAAREAAHEQIATKLAPALQQASARFGGDTSALAAQLERAQNAVRAQIDAGDDADIEEAADAEASSAAAHAAGLSLDDATAKQLAAVTAAADKLVPPRVVAALDQWRAAREKERTDERATLAIETERRVDALCSAYTKLAALLKKEQSAGPGNTDVPPNEIDALANAVRAIDAEALVVRQPPLPMPAELTSAVQAALRAALRQLKTAATLLVELPEAVQRATVSIEAYNKLQASADAKCFICRERDADIAFTTCGHVNTCVQCTQQVTSCPTCGKAVSERVQLRY